MTPLCGVVIFTYKSFILWCPEGDLNPHDRLGSADFKSAVSADFTIRATDALDYRIAFSGC